MIVEKLLYSPLELGDVKNIDERYFKSNDDGTYTPTPLFVYNVARDAEEYFKEKLFKLDENLEFHSESLREVKDTWEEHAHGELWKAKYRDAIALADKEWYKYRDEHPEEFEKKSRVDVGNENETRYFNGYFANVNVGLNEAVKAYNAARALCARFAKPKDEEDAGGPEYKTLPFNTPIYSKPEFAEKHKALRKSWSEKFGIPDDDFEVKTVEKMVPRIKNKACDKLGEDDAAFEPYVLGLINYLTSTNSKDFNDARIRMTKPIDEKFVNTFNDVAQNMKAEMISDNDIKIFTKTTEYKSAESIITITKEADSTFVYEFKFNTVVDREEFKYTRRVATVRNIAHAFERVIELIENNVYLQKYVEDFRNVIDSL